MLFEDMKGNLYTEEQIDEFSSWELEDKGIHLAHDLDSDNFSGDLRFGIN